MTNFSEKPISTTTQKIEEVANMHLEKNIIDNTANNTSLPTALVVKKYVDSKSKVDGEFNPESNNAQSGKAIASALANYPSVNGGDDWVFDGGDSSGNTEIDFVIDDFVSDTSENAISNSAIKKYIDSFKNETNNIISSVADYVVETGQFGIWTYEKWASGKATCKGFCEQTIETQSVAETYLMFDIDLPFTFVSRLPAQITGSRNAWAFYSWYDNVGESNINTKVRPVAYYRVSNLLAGSVVSVSISVDGFWK